MSISTATSWSSDPEAETPNSDSHHAQVPLHHRAIKGGTTQSGEVDDVVGWMRLGGGGELGDDGGDGEHGDEDRPYARMADDADGDANGVRGEPTEVLRPEWTVSRPLDADKLSRIARGFGVPAPRISGARLGVGSGLGASSSSGSVTSRAGSYGERVVSDGRPSALGRYAHSRSSSRSGPIRELTIVASRSVSAATASLARDGFTALAPALASPAYSSFSRASSASAASYAPTSASYTDLITVVPPDHLFLPASYGAGDAEHARDTAQKELRRWRRGRVLPFRASLREMLGAVSKEWGLPSTVGIEVYLVHVRAVDVTAGSDGEGAGNGDDAGANAVEQGGLIGAEVWPMLWAGVRARTTRTRSYDEAATARKMSQPSPLGPGRFNERSLAPAAAETGRPFEPMANPGYLTPTTSGFNFPQPAESPSARSAVSSPGKGSAQEGRTISRRTHQQLGYGHPSRTGKSQVSHSPSTAPVILGKIEFDLDRSKATWYDLWNQRRRESARRGRDAVGGSITGGIRPLVLSETQRGDSSRLQPMGLGPKVAIASEDDPLADTFPSMEDEFDSMRRSRQHRTRLLDETAIGSEAILDPDLELADIGQPTHGLLNDDVAEIKHMLAVAGTGAGAGNPMLASPIDISSPVVGQDIARDNSKFSRVHTLVVAASAPLDKRGSSALMSEELDQLEQRLRDLRPNSMTAEVAQPVTAPAAAAAPPPRTTSMAASAAVRAKRQSPSMQAMLDTQRSLVSPTDQPQAAWPAVPFARTPEALLRGNSGNLLKVTPRSAVDGSAPIPISPETMERMVYEPLPDRVKPASSGWKPQRPPAGPPVPRELLVSIGRGLESAAVETTSGTQMASEAARRAEHGPVSYTAPDIERADGPAGTSLPSASGSIKTLKSQMSIPGLNKLFSRRVSPVTASIAESASMTLPEDQPIVAGPAASTRRSSSRRRPSLWKTHNHNSSTGMSITGPLSPKQMAEYESMNPHIAAERASETATAFAKSPKSESNGSNSFGPRQSSVHDGSGRYGDMAGYSVTRTSLTGHSMTANHPRTPSHGKSPASKNSADMSPHSPSSVRRKPVPRVSSGGIAQVPTSSSVSSDLAGFTLSAAPAGPRKARAVT